MVVLTSGGMCLNIPPKYKRRKVSPFRKFPKGCGISKPSETYSILVGCTESLEDDGLNSKKALNEGVAVKTMETSKHVLMENMMVLDQKELVTPSKTLENCGLNFEKALNEGVAVKTMETPKHVVMENMMVLDQKELVRPSKNLEPKRTSSSKNMNQMEYDGFECNFVLENTSQLEEVDQPQTSIPVLLSMHKHYPPPRRISGFRGFPPYCTRITTSQDSPGCCTRNTACQNFHPGCEGTSLKLSKEHLKLIGSSKYQSSENENARRENRQFELMVMGDSVKRESVHDGDAFKSKDENILKAVKEDAIKESLENAKVKPGPDVSKAITEHDQVQSYSHSKLIKKDTKEDASVRPVSTSNLSLPKPKSSLMSKDVKRELPHPEKESVEPCKEQTLKRKLPKNGQDECSSSSQSQGEVSMGLGSYGNRQIVLALMAAPYCPWRQEEISKSPPPCELVGGKRKKNDAHVNSKFLLIKEDRSSILEVKSTKRKMPPRKDSYQSIDNQIVLRNGRDLPDDGDLRNFASTPREQANCSSLIPLDFHAIVDKHDTEAVITRNKVRETLRIFQVLCRKLLQDEKSRSKEKYNGRRIDIIAADILKEKNKWLNVGKILGNVPGVEVGDEFQFRVELAIIGLHRQYQGGIDYLRQGHRTLATSIVFSGRYDDIDCSESSDVLVYSGQGGNPKIMNKRSEDQRLTRGNLALKNSMDESSPVRVIRGFKQTKAEGRVKTVVTYTYDGLYVVESFWQEKGRYGNKVFKYQLRRIQGQPELALKEVTKSKQLRVRDGLCVADISQGKERMPIAAVNTIDNEKPPSFKYITGMMYPSWYSPTPPKGCQCTNGCSDSEECLCAVKNGGEIPFNYDGDIVFAKPLVYECGPSCKCPPSCHNRVSQHGIKFQLEIFKTKSTGWGVRSLTSIPSGSFVCEYMGELLEEKEAERRTGSDEYLFDIGKNYNDCTLWDGLSNMMPPDLQSSISCDTVEDGGFSIDALKYGNVGRFINHSCSPNLYAQNVLYGHDDKRIPHVMLFAAENIPPLQELTYHYNYNIGHVLDSSGNIKKKQCCCGSDECDGRLY